MQRLLVIAIGLVLGVSWCPAAQRIIALQTLLNEMVDRDALARFPDPPYTSHQASSYDRRSVAPDKPGWFANNDWSQFIRSERHADRTEWVMMDADGPGCVTRLWSGGPKPKGVIRFYLDRNDNPAIEMPAAELIGGTGLVGPPLSQVTARGLNLYLPIPFAKHCKITYDGPNFWQTHQEPDQIWYNIEYRTYAGSAAVESFSRASLGWAEAELKRAAQAFSAPPLALRSESRGAPLEPGAKSTNLLPVAAGAPGEAIRRIRLRMKADDLAAAMRSVVIVFEFDGERTGWCPVGDFFGSGIGSNPFHTFQRSATNNGELDCQWVMPYRDNGSVVLENLGRQSVVVDIGLNRGPWRWNDRSMHFHATWHHQYSIQTKQADGTMDWNYVTIRGRGVYVGDALSVFNPVPDWWGEGDEKIWVDGEKFPSHFGTGSEDFYGYAYGDPHLFSHPFHAQTRCDGPGNQGYTCVTRERSLDAIPFEKSLKVDLEVWHWKATQIGYAATSYWYALPGATAEPGPAPDDAKRALQSVK